MTRTLCPMCQAEVHPYLAPAPVVRAARVVMCCSPACARAFREGSASGGAMVDGVERAAAGSIAAVSLESAASPGSSPVAASAASASAPAAASVEHQGAGMEAALVVSATAQDITALPAQGRLGWRARVHAWPLSAALLAAGIVLLLIAAYLVLEYAGASPGAIGRSKSPRIGARDDATPPRAPPGRERGGAGLLPSSREVRLLALRQRSFETLSGYLGSEPARFRLLSAQVLAEQGDEIAARILRRELGAELWTTRHLAAEALARLGDPEGLGRLKADLASPRLPVRRSAAYALGRVGDPAGLPLLRGLSLQAGHRLTACEALAQLGDEGGKRFLHAVLVGSQPSYDRLRAAVALGLAGDRAGLPLLRARLAEPGMHLGVALALHQLGSPEAVPALRRALAHAALRVEASRALWVQGDLSGLDEVRSSLESESDEARLTGAASIVILTAQARAEVR